MSKPLTTQYGSPPRSAISIVNTSSDEETFDVERVAQCCDSNCYPDGSTIPVCSYNVLYREKEGAFMSEPRTWNARSGGDKTLRRSLPMFGSRSRA